MVMTVLEGRVSPDRADELRRAYREMGAGQLPPQISETFLVRSTEDSDLWRILTVWRSAEDLDAYRKSVTTPTGVRLMILVIAGYLGPWMVFGALVYVVDWSLHAIVDGTAWLEKNVWLIGPGTLALAGLYQFSPLKYRCLDKCRSPFSFIIEHWHGRNQAAEALRLGSITACSVLAAAGR
jgi:quinol monooxygenase YgiN